MRDEAVSRRRQEDQEDLLPIALKQIQVEGYNYYYYCSCPLHVKLHPLCYSYIVSRPSLYNLPFLLHPLHAHTNAQNNLLTGLTLNHYMSST